MPNRLFQGIINQMREATDRIIGVVDESGAVISCSELGLIGEIRKGIIAAGVFIRSMPFLLTVRTKRAADMFRLSLLRLTK